MPDLNLTFVPWPVGTDVRLYPRRSELKLEDQPPPEIDYVATATVFDDGSLTYIDISEGSYWAIAPIDGVYRYVAVFSQEGFVPV